MAMVHSNMTHFWVIGVLLLHQRGHCNWNEAIVAPTCFSFPKMHPISNLKSVVGSICSNEMHKHRGDQIKYNCPLQK